MPSVSFPEDGCEVVGKMSHPGEAAPDALSVVPSACSVETQAVDKFGYQLFSASTA